MGAYGSTLKEDEILKLIAYIRSVTKKNELKMDAKTLFDMHKLMLGNEVIMTYSGYMSQALLTSIASVLKQQIEQDHLPKKVMRNIFSVFVEQYENVVRYSDDQIEEQEKMMLGMELWRYLRKKTLIF